MPGTPDKVELRIPGRPEFIGVARLAVSAVASRLDFDFEALDDIKLAVGEACTNAIQHAGDGKEEIAIRCQLEKERLVIEVADQGAGFDPTACCGQCPDPDALAAHGYGLLLIQALMDEVECKSSPGDGTLVRMVKRLKR